MSRADALGGTSGTITSTSGSTFTGPYSSGNTSAPSSGGFDLDLGDMLSGAFKTDGEYDYGKILGAAGGAASLFGLFGEGSSNRPMGYQGSIPSYTVSRMQVPGTYDPDRRPGSGGQRYFTDVRFDGGDTSEQAAGLEALNRANLAARNRQGTVTCAHSCRRRRSRC